nr:hypothetical protein [Tanacetum cinerariifolium]
MEIIVIHHAQPEDLNELFQKLLEDLKELAEYINFPSRDRPIFFDDNEDHSVQYNEYLEDSSNEIAASNSNQEKEKPPEDSDIRQLIREKCCIEVCEEQKQNMENTILDALNTKLLSINLNSQRLDKKKQEVKNVVEQPTERRTRIEKSLQNFRLIHKSSISLKNRSQISLVHAITPILSNKGPEYSLSMGYEHPNTTLEMESDEIIKYGVKELVPILNENKDTSEDKKECDMLDCENSPVCDNHSDILSDSNNDDDISNDDDAFEDIKYVEASLPDPKIVSLKEKNVVHQEEEKESDNFLSDNSSSEFETFSDQTEETRSGSTITYANDSLPEYDSFCFEIEPDQERLINIVKNDIFDDSTNDPLLEEVDLFLPQITRYHQNYVIIHDDNVPIEESKVHSNPLFDNDKINSDELESHVESNFVKSLSTHDALIDSSQKFENLNEFSGPLIPIYIAEEERIRREHADYISRMEMLFTINPRPHPTVNINTIVESIPSSFIPVQDGDSQQEEIDIVTNTDELLPPGFENDDSDGEIDAVAELRVDNSIFNSEHEYSGNEESDFDNPSVPLPPSEPPDAKYDFELDAGDENFSCDEC